MSKLVNMQMLLSTQEKKIRERTELEDWMTDPALLIQEIKHAQLSLY